MCVHTGCEAFSKHDECAGRLGCVSGAHVVEVGVGVPVCCQRPHLLVRQVSILTRLCNMAAAATEGGTPHW